MRVTFQLEHQPHTRHPGHQCQAEGQPGAAVQCVQAPHGRTARQDQVQVLHGGGRGQALLRDEAGDDGQ